VVGQCSESLVEDLEHRMRHKSCGPTNETLVKFMKELSLDRIQA
ncbi:uncharacterized protein METZ01_LOCUS128880, partial [marine metagenome]